MFLIFKTWNYRFEKNNWVNLPHRKISTLLIKNIKDLIGGFWIYKFGASLETWTYIGTTLRRRKTFGYGEMFRNFKDFTCFEI